MPGPYLFTDAKIQTSLNIQNVRLFFMLKSIVLLIYIKKKVLIWEYTKQDCNIKRQIQADNHSGSKQNVKNPFSLIIPVLLHICQCYHPQALISDRIYEIAKIVSKKEEIKFTESFSEPTSRHTDIKKAPANAGAFYIIRCFLQQNYPPKLSYMIEELSTPRLSSMLTTAFDIGPGPHM